MPDFVSFNEYVDQTAAAKVEHHRETISNALRRRVAPTAAFLSAPATGVTDDVVDEQFAKMKQYVVSRCEGITSVKATFLGSGGAFFDCVAFEQQPTYRVAKNAGHNVSVNAPAPSPRRPPGNIDPNAFAPMVSSTLPPLLKGLEDPFGNSMACPDGYVPLKRVTIAQMARRGRFEDFFRKYPLAPPFAGTIGSTEIHHHAICNVTNGGNYFGCSTWLNVWEVDPSPGVFSLSQLWLCGYTTAGVIQTIESGWQTFPGAWGTSSPVLFVFYNPNGYDPNSSGYVSNSQHFGFIQQPGSGWIIGDAMPQPYSTVNGDQHGNQMQWQIDAQGNWWLFFGTGDQTPAPLGFFPAGLYGNGPLASSAQVLQFGGEVCSQNPGDPTYPASGKMGSGIAPFSDPTDSFREVAFQKQLAVQPSLGGPLVHASLQVASDPHDAGYSASQVTDSGSDSWGSYMYFGGSRSLWP